MSLSPPDCEFGHLLDSGPSWVVKTVQQIKYHWFHAVVLASLSDGVVSFPLKKMVVHCLLRKPHLGLVILNKSQPISNFPFLGRSVEKVVGQLFQGILKEKYHHFTQMLGQDPVLEIALIVLDDFCQSGWGWGVHPCVPWSHNDFYTNHGILVDQLQGWKLGAVISWWLSVTVFSWRLAGGWLVHLVL